jgi:hypothetical protein
VRGSVILAGFVRVGTTPFRGPDLRLKVGDPTYVARSNCIVEFRIEPDKPRQGFNVCPSQPDAQRTLPEI